MKAVKDWGALIKVSMMSKTDGQPLHYRDRVMMMKLGRKNPKVLDVILGLNVLAQMETGEEADKGAD